MAENLMRPEWAAIEQADLRLLLKETIGQPGQYDGEDHVLHLPLARDKCRISLTFDGPKILSIARGQAFERSQWADICQEIEDSLLNGPKKIGREITFSTYRVDGSWRSAESGVQILPPPADAPRAPVEMADHPFILEFPVQDAGRWSITNQRRIREHHRLTLLLNVLLAGTVTFLRDRPRHFWASARINGVPEIAWVQEHYFAKIGEVVLNQLSPANGPKLTELPAETYYVKVGHDGQSLRVPDDLDHSICRYKKLPPNLRASQ